jgi:lipoprotein-anchoring transpeptidase ErfK/SrfK
MRPHRVALFVLLGVLASSPGDAAEERKSTQKSSQSAQKSTQKRKSKRAVRKPKVKPTPPPITFTAADANNASLTPVLDAKSAGSPVLRAQVLLDRAHFSVGEIDGHFGDSTVRAVTAYNKERALPGGGSVTAETWAALNRDTRPVVVAYSVTAEDLAGPFYEVPEEMADKAKLPSSAYSSPMEAIAERFHMSPKLLAKLNGDAPLAAGASIHVADVGRAPLPLQKAAAIKVDETDLSVSALDAQGRILARYPATVGSEKDPLPLGDWKVNGVSWNPPFNYNPDLFWDSEPGETKVKVPPGPNNPVGVAWIDLSKKHYGIHGTPEPQTIGKTSSHGCIRLTNWDAAELGGLVAPGTPAHLVK